MKRIIIQILAVILTVALCAAVIMACTPDEEAQTYTVTYAAGGGTGTAPEAEQYEQGETFTVKDGGIFTRDGYTFAGWNDGENNVEAGATYTMPDKDVTFTAIWNKTEEYGIEGKWSGATMDGKDVMGVSGVTFDVDATVQKDGASAVYVVLGITGSVEAEGETPVAVKMTAAIRLPISDNGTYAEEGTTLSYANNKLTLSVTFGSEATDMVFDEWKALGTAPSVSGSYTASDDDNVYTLTFGDNPTLTVVKAEQGNKGGDSEENGGTQQGGTEQEEENPGMDELRNGNYDIKLYDAEDGLGGDDNNGEMTGPDGDGNNGEMTDPDGGANGDTPDPDEREPETVNIEKIVPVGEYLVVFVKDEGYAPATYDNEQVDGAEQGDQGNTDQGSGNGDQTQGGNEQDQLRAILVLYDGEDGALIGNTGEGDILVFTKQEA